MLVDNRILFQIKLQILHFWRERDEEHKHLQINTNSLGLNQTAGNSCVDESSAAASSTWRNCVLGLCCLPTLPADRRLQPGAPAIQAPPDRSTTQGSCHLWSLLHCARVEQSCILLLALNPPKHPKLLFFLKADWGKNVNICCCCNMLPELGSRKVTCRHSREINYKRAKWWSLP